MSEKDKSKDKDYVDIKDVKKTRIEKDFVKCPMCGDEQEYLGGYSYEMYLEEKEAGRNIFDGWDSDIKDKIDDKGIFFPCYRCGFIFPKNHKDREEYWYKKEVEALICPKCGLVVSKTPSNFTFGDTGYLCPTCLKILEYHGYPHHGSGSVKVRATTDYFHGVCPNCKPENGHGMMVLGEQIWVEDNGKVVLPLVCRNCGYRDAVK